MIKLLDSYGYLRTNATNVFDEEELKAIAAFLGLESIEALKTLTIGKIIEKISVQKAALEQQKQNSILETPLLNPSVATTSDQLNSPKPVELPKPIPPVPVVSDSENDQLDTITLHGTPEEQEALMHLIINKYESITGKTLEAYIHYSKENIPDALQTIIHMPIKNSNQFQSFFTFLQGLQQEGKITYNENKVKALEPNPETFSNQNNNLNFSRGL